jgi:hypothetical protein
MAKATKTEEVEVSDTVSTVSAKAEKNSTTFEFKNGGTRTFSVSVHGKGWEDLADEFAVTT